MPALLHRSLSFLSDSFSIYNLLSPIPWGERKALASMLSNEYLPSCLSWGIVLPISHLLWRKPSAQQFSYDSRIWKSLCILNIPIKKMEHLVVLAAEHSKQCRDPERFWAMGRRIRMDVQRSHLQAWWGGMLQIPSLQVKGWEICSQTCLKILTGTPSKTMSASRKWAFFWPTFWILWVTKLSHICSVSSSELFWLLIGFSFKKLEFNLQISQN